VQGHAVENLDLGTIPDDQPLDDIDAVQLGLDAGELGQVPTRGRGRTTCPLLAIQSSTTTEDAVDGSHRGNLGHAPIHQRLADGVGTDGPQIPVTQLLPRLDHQILQGGIRAARLVGSTRAIRPIDAVQALALGPLDPKGYRRHTDAVLLGDRSKRLATPNGVYQGSTTRDLPLCLLMGLPPVGSLEWKL
jgi:hypothetical protein